MKKKTFNKLKKAFDKTKVIDDLLFKVRDDLIGEEVQMVSRHMSLQDTLKDVSNEINYVNTLLESIINFVQEEDSIQN